MARLVLLFALLSLGFSQVSALGGAMQGLEDAMQIQREQLARLGDFLGPTPQLQSVAKRESTITFSNPAAEKFFVDGTTIPDVNFDAGPSWSGLMPISGDPNETRKLFFWFWPTTNASNTKDLIFWTNGGPGCSSLEGFLQENGPISWSWGQAEPTPNPFAWNSLGHMIWVEQPVGTGFSQGTPNITNDDQLAQELVGFFEQFLEVFSELKGNNLWLTGESYAGFYVPRIANWIYEHPGLDLALKGIWIADPSLSYGVVQQDIPALRFAQANKNVFPFNSTFMAQLQATSDSCGYTDYVDKFVTYPPAGPLPFPAGVPKGSTSASTACRLHSPIQRAVGVLNPVFNVYRVTDTFPNLWSVLGFPRSTQEFVYFNRTDVKSHIFRERRLLTSSKVQDAIHAPHIVWETCSDGSVYLPGGDRTVPSMLTAAGSNISVLGNVIEKSVRTVVVHGLADMILMSEGTRIAIQNMTWGGLQGFQTPIEPESFKVKNMGVFGNEHTERGLTYVEFYYSGHMTPQFVPWAAFSTISFLLGKQATPSSG
ncbi:Carboxypeptidase [Mycena indigotica]|uniref:Carboxypeptidase n=1 Tax=Mycena indigotica TaxID=2126181 RepID=A0A8H6TD97_9AGAR|nr:Carboxypeptidase [Mycena indigotica]KAF7315184.1 Carboxypeptidase [Mycena indigotica]